VKGNVVGVQTRGPDKNLEKEAQRIIEKLPKMIPGKQRGKPVRVPYSIPITFRLQ
jgi:periplasmic protein TonB